MGIGQIGGSLCEEAESWGALRPSHGENKGESDKRLLMREMGKGNAQDGDVCGTQPDAVVAIGDVQLQHENGAVCGVGMV